MNIRASKISAFFSGLSLTLIASLLDFAQNKGMIDFNAESRNVFPFIAIYFLVTGILFVIGIEAIKAKLNQAEKGTILKPTSKEDRQVYYSAWGRMCLWFVGGIIGGVWMIPLI
jgi:hypothetical protein